MMSDKPIAYMYQNEDTGVTGFVDEQQVEWGFEKNNPRLKIVERLYSKAQYEELEANVKTLEASRRLWKGLAIGANKNVAYTNLRAKNKELKAEVKHLKQYANHRRKCIFWNTGRELWYDDDKCNCGLGNIFKKEQAK